MAHVGLLHQLVHTSLTLGHFKNLIFLLRYVACKIALNLRWQYLMLLLDAD